MIKNIKNKQKEDGYMTGIYTITLRDIRTGKITQQYEIKNIIPTVGRTMVVNNLTSSSPDNAMRINYIALGTGSTAVSNVDTTLDTEIHRKQTSSATNSNNIGYVTGFFTATEVVDTIKEAGLFSDGTATTDSGILVSRVLLNAPTGIVKSNTESLTIDWVITLS